MKKIALHNLGCKVNSYETDAVSELLKESGYEIVPFDRGADIYIVNTCTVTAVADKKSRQMIHRARSMNPDALVIAMGCYVQNNKKEALSDYAADIIVGNNNKKKLPKIISDYEKMPGSCGRKSEYVLDLHENKDYESLFVTCPGEHTRGFIKVQDGCDRFCTYCVIPYVRGRSRSRSMEDILNEAESLAQSGCREIILNGIHLSSYGKDLKNSPGLFEVVRSVSEIDKINRIRLGSLEPGIITEDFVRNLAGIKKICPHFHLSLQSGCDKTLKAMNRKYTVSSYEGKCLILRRYFDNPSITTDIITGFPGETEEDFRETYEFADRMNFFETHIFPYSKRKGTKAALLPGQVSEADKKTRTAMLLDLNARKRKKRFEILPGTYDEVLVEEYREINSEKYWVGHSPRYEKIALKSDINLKNKILKVKITGALTNDCLLSEM